MIIVLYIVYFTLLASLFCVSIYRLIRSIRAKNTEQQVQLDSEQKQGTFDNPVDASIAAAPRKSTEC